MKKSLLLIFSTYSLYLLSACGGGAGGSTPTSTVATHLSVAGSPTATAGAAFNFTVTALDASNATATGYSGIVHFSSTDVPALLPVNSTLTNGTGTFSATLKTIGSQTITATDTVKASITGTSTSISVSTAAATHFSVTAPATAPAGSSITLTVTAQDASNNVATGYTGSLHFSSTDVPALVPTNSTLTNGTGTFSATLKTLGNQTISAIDTVTPTITGTSNAINVIPPAPLTITSGQPPNGTVGELYPGSIQGCLGPIDTGFELTASGGQAGGQQTGGYSWSGSSLPPGLQVSKIIISGPPSCPHGTAWVIDGKPTVAGTYKSVVITVTDFATPPAHASATYTITISAAAGANPAAFKSPDLRNQHHHYKVIQMGTFGGPNSGIDVTGNPPKFPFNKVLTQSGEVLGTADTTIPDPYCFVACLVDYAFLWKDGVQTNLGVLPQSPVIGPQTPCFDCGWSVFTFWIADNGLVAGQSTYNSIDPYTGTLAPLAVLWKDGKIFNLGTLGGNESGAGAVNRRGEVVGGALTSTPDPFPFRVPYLNYFFFGNGTESHAFLWHDGNMKDLGTLGGPDSAAFLVNDEGQVAGSSDVDYSVNPATGGPTVHPFLWQHGKMIDLVASAPEGMFGGTYGIAAWLNDKGQVLGTMNLPGDTSWRSFVWDKGVITPLGTLGGITTTAQFLNNAGHAVGKSDVTTICAACAPGNQIPLHHPFLWRDGTMIDLGLLYDDTAGNASSVNEKDQVVGVTVPCNKVNTDDSCEGPLYHAFLWENGSMVDVQTLLVPGSGITLSGCAGCELGAYNINDRGEIAGQGLLSNGDSRAVLLIPCDEDHPDVEGCDYNTVEVVTESQVGPALLTQAPSASPTKLSPAEMLTPPQSLRAGRQRRNETQTSPN